MLAGHMDELASWSNITEEGFIKFSPIEMVSMYYWPAGCEGRDGMYRANRFQTHLLRRGAEKLMNPRYVH
jgi:hypothetical protein